MWHSSEHSKIAGSYELKNTLGKGHFAVVKLAHHVFTGEKVAVKVIDKTKMDQISTDHLYHEVTCMKLVQHPNVVRLYQVIETPSKLYLILELGDGGDMFDYIMRHDQGLHEDQAKEYFAQIVSAIAYCHKLHVVHRDLKPENVVFFESQGLVKLTDFGFSNQYQPGEKLSTSCGSLAYSAPEILLGEEYDAPAVDVWSLGVILYMLVCGIAPFNEANDSETLVNIMECRFTVLDHVSEECSDLINRMIIREPNDRIGLDEIVAHPWLKGVKSLSRARRNSTPILAHSKLSEELQNSIISTMVKANLGKRDDILEAIKEKRYDHVTSTYFLLAERALLNQVPKTTKICVDELNIGDSAADRGPASMPQTIPNRLRPLHPEKPAQNSLATALAASPPCKQSTLVPSDDFNRRRTASSSSEEGSSFFERKSSYIREHLTITPRKGFSVAHGGIDMLIEEEERSRSQTTTDDEGEACEDIPLNPNTLASHLQRTSLQKNKRMQKKRKSTPVLNEICEETELENDLANTPTNHISPIKENATPGTQYMGDGNPSNILSGVFDVFKGKKFLPKTLGNNRTGRTHQRRKSQRSSGSETSDDESGSRRESRTNLSAAVNAVFFPHRRDSDDRDHDDNFRRPNGGGTNREAFHNIAEESRVERGKDGGDGSAEMEQSGHHGASGSEKTSSLNNNISLNEAFLSKRTAAANLSRNKIVNILVPRSRSAESRSSSYSIITSRSSSSARSSCSSLSTSHQLRSISRKSRRAAKNSSSTRSDTGLVLRCHVNNTKMKCTCGSFRRSSSSSSIRDQTGSVRVCSSMVNVRANNDDFGTLRYHRSCSLPRQSRKLANVTEVDTRSKARFPSSDTGEGWNTAVLNNDAVSTKRSNLSLVSSTCSGSKFVVDPVNELSRSPSLMPLPEVEANFISSKNDGATSPKQLKTSYNREFDNPSRSVFRTGGKLNILTKLNNLNQHHRKYKTENVFVRRVKNQDCCLVM